MKHIRKTTGWAAMLCLLVPLVTAAGAAAAQPGMTPAKPAGMAPGMAPAGMAGGAAMATAPPPAGGDDDDGAPPAPEPAGSGPTPAADDFIYSPVEIEVSGLVWYGPGQRGLIEANQLVMGLAAMALATVTLLFFFLRGIKRRKDDVL